MTVGALVAWSVGERPDGLYHVPKHAVSFSASYPGYEKTQRKQKSAYVPVYVRCTKRLLFKTNLLLDLDMGNVFFVVVFFVFFVCVCVASDMFFRCGFDHGTSKEIA